VRVHDVLDRRGGQAIPAGVSAMTPTGGGVNVGGAQTPAACAGATVPQGGPRMAAALDPTGHTGSDDELAPVP
jgi:hypothetical protein